MMMEHDNSSSHELRDELAALVAAFNARLRWQQQRGLRWVAAAPAPRGAPMVERVVEPEAEQPGAPPPAAQPAGVAPAPGLADPLAPVREELGDCRRCRLADERNNLVFGVGSATADLMFVGEAPGSEEDRQGEPFVGTAGQLLTRMIRAMGLERDEVYICNIIKCRPPGNRDPRPDEIEQCEPFLLRQIESIAPRMIVALGNFAAKTLLRTDVGITRLRGRWHAYHGIPVMPTFHPAYLLRNPDGKRPVWLDLQQVMAEMDRLGLRTPKSG